MSHLGRPDGRKTKDTLRPVAEHLATLLPGVHVGFVEECVGPSVEEEVKKLKVCSSNCLEADGPSNPVSPHRMGPSCCWKT